LIDRVVTAPHLGEEKLKNEYQQDDGSDGDNWSYKTCKAPVKSSPPTNQHPDFYRLDILPVSRKTVSEHWRECQNAEYLYETASKSATYFP